MTVFDRRLALCASAALSYALVKHAPEDMPVQLRKSYLGVFVQLCLIQLIAWVIYAMFLRPYWLSPLTKLPQPKVGVGSSVKYCTCLR